MIKCHICGLETKQLNGLMTKHWQQHCSDEYTKEQYKVDLLNYNGRKQKICKICNKPTSIPKGGAEYSDYHKRCYIKHMTSAPENNPNYSGGVDTIVCTNCGSKKKIYSSMLNGVNKFCSTSCSTLWYRKPENMTEAVRLAAKKNTAHFKMMNYLPKVREKIVKARVKLQTTRKSKKEIECVNLIKSIYPQTHLSYQVKYYEFDGFIPELNLLIEFDGTYWHSLPKAIKRDKRKSLYIKRWHKHLSILRIPEGEWDSAYDKLTYIKQKIQDRT